MGRSRYQEIAASLRQDIVNGLFRNGTLPAEKELCEIWGTSRGPVRNALALLRQQGYIETGRGSASRIITQMESQSATSYVPFTKWAKASGHKPGGRTIQIALMRADPWRAKQLGIAAGSMAVELRRLRLLDDRPVMLERSLFLKDVGRLLIDENLDDCSITEILAGHDIAFSSTRYSIESIAANAEEAQLIGIREGDPLLRLQRTTTDQNGRVFECADDRYQAGIVSFRVENTPPTSAGPYDSRASMALRTTGTPKLQLLAT